MQSVLQITRRADYALRAAVYLASISDGRIVTFRDMAGLIAVPADFLAKILKELADHDIVRSVRGPKGGYALARSGREISFLQVIEAVEGPISLNVCLESTDACVFAEDCTLIRAWRRGQDRMLEVFRETTLESLTHPHPLSRKVADAGAEHLTALRYAEPRQPR